MLVDPTTGRDATDVALSNTSFPNALTKAKVWADEVKTDWCSRPVLAVVCAA